MRIGELDQRIIIEDFTTIRGTSGEEIKTWTPWKTVWAEVQTSSGTENFHNPQLIAEATHKIKLRYLTGVKPTMQIDWRGNILDILFVDESRRRQGEMNLLCREVVKP
ncbi:MAG: phage head closure protein [Deltaproteobacteria bacterium]